MISLGAKNEYGTYKAHWSNGVLVGDLIIGDDGYYAWWPVRERDGCFNEFFLFEMFKTLQKLNKEWHDIVSTDPAIGGNIAVSGHGSNLLEQGESL